MASHDDFTPEIPDVLDTVFWRDVSDAGTGLTDGIGVSTWTQVMQTIMDAAGFSAKHNMAASVAPGVSDDSTADYEAGSMWVDTVADEVYICADPAAGAAVWKQVASGGGGGVTEKGIEDIIEAETPVSPDSSDEILWRDVSGTDQLGASTITQLGAKLITDGGLLQDSDFTSASLGVLTKLSAGTYQVTRYKLNATASPTATDDSAAGYSLGSLWIDTTPSGSETIFMCVDDTASAAVWVQIGTDSVSLRAEWSTWSAAAPAAADTFPFIDADGTVGRATSAQIVTEGGGALAPLNTVGTSEIDDEAVTNAKLAHMATDTIKGRTTAGTGDAEDLTAAQARTLLNVENGATADQTGAEIKTAYEGEANTNAFTDAEQTKLSGIATGAQVNVIENVVEDTTPQLGGNLDGNGFSVQDVDDVSITEAADHTTASGAAKSILWVRNDAPTTLMHTDDAGSDHELHPPATFCDFLVDVGATSVSINTSDRLLNSNGILTKADLTRFTQVRIIVIRGGVGTFTTLDVGVRYHTSLSLTYGDYVALGASSTDVEVTPIATNTAYESSWVDITSAARADVALAVYQKNANTTQNGSFLRITVEFR